MRTDKEQVERVREEIAKSNFQFAFLIDDKEIDVWWARCGNKERWFDSVDASFKRAPSLRIASEDQSLPFCDRFRWHDIDECETKCDFELMAQHCPLLSAHFERTIKLDEVKK